MNNPFVISVLHNDNTLERVPRFRIFKGIKTPKWCLNHEDIVNLCDWVELNILLDETATNNWFTAEVKTRIATCMMFKLTSIPQDEKLIVVNNVQHNIYNILQNMRIESLPF